MCPTIWRVIAILLTKSAKVFTASFYYLLLNQQIKLHNPVTIKTLILQFNNSQFK